MKTIIKAEDAAAWTVRPLEMQLPSVVSRRSLSSQDDLTDSTGLFRQVGVLTEQVRRQNVEIVRLRKESAEAHQAGEADGRRLGLSEASDQSQERLEALRSTAAAALKKFDQALESLERLGALIAHEALARVLGDAAKHAELVSQIIRKIVSGLAEESTLAIVVAQADFPDTDSLSELIARHGRSGLNISASNALVSGDCQIRLTLGGLEVGVNQQWATLKKALLELAQPETTS